MPARERERRRRAVISTAAEEQSRAPRVDTDVSLTHSLSRIGVAPHAASILDNAASRPNGMILFCGPAGMGKTAAAQPVAAGMATDDEARIMVPGYT